MNIALEILDLNNAQDVYDFEVENRAYFEKNLASRGDAYYIYEEYSNIIKEILDEQSRKECYMYVISYEERKVVGRINFSSVIDDKIKSAELGYRIGQAYTGKGIATKAIQMALKLAAENHGLNKIIAGTSSDNIASQKALEKNGFIFAEKTKNYMKVNGKWIDNLSYIRAY